MEFTLDRLRQDFTHYYGEKEQPVLAFFAPGRVNLLGEHTDYNGGFVLPFSIQQGIFLLIRISEDPLWKFRSENFDFRAEISVTDQPRIAGKTWVNYPLGVMLEFIQAGTALPGLELLYYGNIPNGAGLSSSAAIELVTAIALDRLFGTNFTDLEMITMAQRAENDFVGMKCGIMDQFAVAKGEKDNLLFLDCATLNFEMIPVFLGEYGLIITHSNVRRELAGSAYNSRRKECAAVLNILKNHVQAENLSDIKVEQWNTLEDRITDPVLKKRARHVIFENQRVVDGIDQLKNRNLKAFGETMVQSHLSLKNDYEVSCRELDFLVEHAMETEGVLGSRLTGAGFGGCTISLVKKDQLEKFKKNVGQKYTKATGLIAEFYPAQISDGMRFLMEI